MLLQVAQRRRRPLFLEEVLVLALGLPPVGFPRFDGQSARVVPVVVATEKQKLSVDDVDDLLLSLDVVWRTLALVPVSVL